MNKFCKQPNIWKSNKASVSGITLLESKRLIEELHDKMKRKLIIN
jgi:hypothetical protein